MTHDELLERLADLAVEVGANVQPGQIVTVAADVGHEELARSVAASAYRRGAQFVDVSYFDPYVKRARIEFSDPDTLDFVPPWYGERVLELGRVGSARIVLAGPADTSALEGLNAQLLGQDQLPSLKEWMTVLNSGAVNWVVVPCPTRHWAELCYPELDADTAFEKFSDDIAYVCRLDTADSAGAWDTRDRELRDAAARLNDLSLDALAFHGPGTDLTIGLLPTSTWLGGGFTRNDGLGYQPNIPTEEVFTTPDPGRVDGNVRATRPLVLTDGTIVRGLEVRFESGRAVQIDADEGAELMRGRTRQDEGATRLGEVALVDSSSRIGQLGTVFYETLLDENAASHLAFGDGFAEAVGDADADRANRSGIHVDFMIGGPDVSVTGITKDGHRLPVLVGGEWQI